MALLPLFDGAVNAIETCPLPAVALPIVGAPGTVAAVEKEALTDKFPLTVKVQLGKLFPPEQVTPDQLDNTAPTPEALNVTLVPDGKLALHVAPQSSATGLPGGVALTDPLAAPVPTRLTVTE